MEAFYDSEEEIAWGPRTRREINADLFREQDKIKINRRHTTLVNIKDDTMNFTDALSKLNISNHSSEYYTANDTVNTAASSNETFLEKVSKVINEDLPRTSIPQQTILLDNEQLTLVENTIVLSSSEDDDEESPVKIKQELNYSLYKNDDTFRTAQEEVIVLEDSEDEEYMSDDEDCLTDKEDNLNIDCKQILATSNENVINYEHSFTSDYEEDSSYTSDPKNNTCFSDSDLNEIKLQSFNRKSSPIQVPEIDINQFDTSSDFDNFNDTMEEIERALQDGLDYKMPEDNIDYEKENIVVNETPQKMRESIISGSFMNSQIVEDIQPKKENFKVPLLTPKVKSQIPVQKLQMKYKDIVSPIRIYINNTTTCLKKNVVPEKTVSKQIINEKCRNNKLFPKEDQEFPEVVYKPAKQTVKSRINPTKLPSSIKKLVQEPNILKHEARYYNKNLNKAAIHQKLLDGNLTVVDDSFMNSTNNFDLSVQVSKQGFIM